MFINDQDAGAHFSNCRKYRYALWRIWDHSKPLIMLIGLNPSTANEIDADPTIESVGRIMKFNGYGGFYMMNCFPYVSTKPEDMILCEPGSKQWKSNETWLWYVSKKCKTICFAWGAFAIVKKMNRDKELIEMFPNALCLGKTKDGSPRHPLFLSSITKLEKF